MKIRIKYMEKEETSNMMESDNYISLYLFEIIKIKKIKIERKIHTDNKTGNNKEVNTFFMIAKQIIKLLQLEEINKIAKNILKTIKVNKLDLNLGINFSDPILNAYSIAIINSVLPIFLISNNRNINLDKIRYNTYISKKVVDLKVDSIISVSIVKNIISILKIVFLIVKGGIKNGNKTSNRISNDNFNDFNRKYGRC